MAHLGSAIKPGLLSAPRHGWRRRMPGGRRCLFIIPRLSVDIVPGKNTLFLSRGASMSASRRLSSNQVAVDALDTDPPPPSSSSTGTPLPIKTVRDSKHGILRVSPSGKRWESVIGLEVHAQIAAHSKLFSSAPTSYNRPVNSQVSYFDAAIPGTLPVMNERCVIAGVQTALALNSNINLVSFFDRKHYFYADLPAGYQITQQRRPIAEGGHLKFPVTVEEISKKIYTKNVDIIQIQIEQDSGKSLHDDIDGKSLIDLNRCGSGLLEIVFGPCLQHGDEAAALALELQLIMQWIKTCWGRMERGEMRVDANISVREPGGQLGVRTEVKNLNSMKSVAKAIEYEVARQIEMLEAGEKVQNETRGFNFNTKQTFSMRDKEKKQDYRFMPEPNLPPLRIKQELVDSLSKELPQLPAVIREQLTKEYGLPSQATSLLVEKQQFLNFFQECMRINPASPKILADTLLVTVQELLIVNQKELSEVGLTPEAFLEAVNMKVNREISATCLRELLVLMLNGDDRPPRTIVTQNQWFMVSDPKEIQEFVNTCLDTYSEGVEKYVKAKEKRRGMIFSKILGQINQEHPDKCERLDMAKFSESLRHHLDSLGKK